MIKLVSGEGVEMLAAAQPAEYARWESLAGGAPTPDCYYRPGYAAAYEKAEPSRAIALLLPSPGGRVLVSLMVREWTPGSGGASVVDGYSPYGYGGWLPLEGAEPPLEDTLAALDRLRRWCAAQGLTCCVLRLHPLLNQVETFARLPKRPELVLAPSIETCAIDLGHWDEGADRPADLAKRRRSYLSSAGRNLELRTWTGEECVQAGCSYLREFCRLYTADMERLNAAAFLRFPEEYFLALARGLGEEFMLAMAFHDGKAVGGVIFFLGRDFAHYHLSTSDEEGRRLGSTALLIVHGAQLARARGARWLHLGGGNRPGDTLFHFKRSFGGRTWQYSTFTLIADLPRYQALCGEPGIRWPYVRVAGR
ncbi:MAG TPA: GNAT family N-acetyltransferase [Terriglobales bacterium]|nr:GNAT family N-acetyltransferase [Terriglobales bacterium]